MALSILNSSQFLLVVETIVTYKIELGIWTLFVIRTAKLVERLLIVASREKWRKGGLHGRHTMCVFFLSRVISKYVLGF